MIPESVLDEHLKAMESGKVVSFGFPPESIQIALSIAQQGRAAEFMGTNGSLYPMEVIEGVDGTPFTLIMHGREDSLVPGGGSIKFAERIIEKFGEGKVVLYTQPGEHGFDGTAALETPWLKEALCHVTEAWFGVCMY